MNLYYFSVLTAIVANIGYHLSVKFVSHDVNPFASLAVTYGVALACCLILIPFVSNTGYSGAFQNLNWTVFTLGISVCFLELGFLLAYRAGWKLSDAGLVVNVSVGLLLIPIGVFILKEKLSAYNWVGIGLAVTGLFLIGKKS